METVPIRLQLDGRWKLEELVSAAQNYIQLYGFAYSLALDLPRGSQFQIDYIYGQYPWRGGYSTVNFFKKLFHQIPPAYRPEIKRIQYASPGYIELAQIAGVAYICSKIVKSVCVTIDTAHDTYRKIQKGMIEHRLTSLDVKEKELELTKKQVDYCKTSSEKLVKIFGFSEIEDSLIDHRTQGVPLAKLKMLLSVYRRARPLAQKQAEGKLTIGAEPDEKEKDS